MNPGHDLYCDRNHTPRQRCNGALANARISAELSPRDPPQPEPVPEPAAHDAFAVVAPSTNGGAPHTEEPQPDATRDAVATAEVPEPTAYVTREWGKTAAAVEAAHRPSRPPAPTERRRAPGPAIALAGALISLVLLLLVMRKRSRESPQ